MVFSILPAAGPALISQRDAPNKACDAAMAIGRLEGAEYSSEQLVLCRQPTLRPTNVVEESCRY